MSARRPIPVTLEGRHVRLEPLSLEKHFQGLLEIGLEPELWRWTLTVPSTREEFRAYLQEGLDEQARGKAVPFAVIERTSERVVGHTRYANIEPAHGRLEIGWTWYGLPWQRTPVNTETKLLLLTNAFEQLGMQRVELKTDALNERSRKAILRIGAKFEGIFRKHGVASSGRIRDTAYFSIIDDEWPEARRRLVERLNR